MQWATVTRRRWGSRGQEFPTTDSFSSTSPLSPSASPPSSSRPLKCVSIILLLSSLCLKGSDQDHRSPSTPTVPSRSPTRASPSTPSPDHPHHSPPTIQHPDQGQDEDQEEGKSRLLYTKQDDDEKRRTRTNDKTKLGHDSLIHHHHLLHLMSLMHCHNQDLKDMERHHSGRGRQRQDREMNEKGGKRKRKGKG